MPSDGELWACALHIERAHGKDAPTFEAERIGALVLAGDEEGIVIAERLDKLQKAQMQEEGMDKRG